MDNEDQIQEPDDDATQAMFEALRAKYQADNEGVPEAAPESSPFIMGRVPCLSDQLVLEAAALMNQAAGIMASGNGIAAVFTLQTAQATATVALVEAVHEFTRLFQTIGQVAVNAMPDASN